MRGWHDKIRNLKGLKYTAVFQLETFTEFCKGIGGEELSQKKSEKADEKFLKSFVPEEKEIFQDFHWKLWRQWSKKRDESRSSLIITPRVTCLSAAQSHDWINVMGVPAYWLEEWGNHYWHKLMLSGAVFFFFLNSQCLIFNQNSQTLKKTRPYDL